jgi:hypothetical protein
LRKPNHIERIESLHSLYALDKKSEAGDKNIYCIYANHMSEPFCKIHALTEGIDGGVLKKKKNIENSDYFFYELK